MAREAASKLISSASREERRGARELQDHRRVGSTRMHWSRPVRSRDEDIS